MEKWFLERGTIIKKNQGNYLKFLPQEIFEYILVIANRDNNYEEIKDQETFNILELPRYKFRIDVRDDLIARRWKIRSGKIIVKKYDLNEAKVLHNMWRDKIRSNGGIPP